MEVKGRNKTPHEEPLTATGVFRGLDTLVRLVEAAKVSTPKLVPDEPLQALIEARDRVCDAALGRVVPTPAPVAEPGPAPNIPREPANHTYSSAGRRKITVAAGGVVEYEATRLLFLASVIEPLADAAAFRVITPHGTFQMTKAQFYETFSNIVETRSWREAGHYHSSLPPQKAMRYLVSAA